MARPLPWHEPEMGSNPYILVVGADDGARAGYTRSCALARWDVVEASDGREALTTALVRPPTVVLTDTRLPFLDGVRAVRDSASRLCDGWRSDCGPDG